MVTFLTQLLLAIRSRFARRARLEAENLILRRQLRVLRRKSPARVRLWNIDRLRLAGCIKARQRGVRSPDCAEALMLALGEPCSARWAKYCSFRPTRRAHSPTPSIATSARPMRPASSSAHTRTKNDHPSNVRPLRKGGRFKSGGLVKMFALRSCEPMLTVETHACARLNGVTIHGPNMWSAIVVTDI
jgi:hypothetical protein